METLLGSVHRGTPPRGSCPAGAPNGKGLSDSGYRAVPLEYLFGGSIGLLAGPEDLAESPGIAAPSKKITGEEKVCGGMEIKRRDRQIEFATLDAFLV